MVEFGVELGEEQHLKSTILTVFLEDGGHAQEVGLGVKESTNAAVDMTGWAVELGAFTFETTDLVTKPTLLENNFHPLEVTCRLVAFREVEQLRRSIGESSRAHLDLLHQLLPIWSVELGVSTNQFLSGLDVRSGILQAESMVSDLFR